MVMHKRAKGNKAEDIACDFISREGFVVIERNYLKKWGELDIVAKKGGVLHFFEVKSTFAGIGDQYRPIENIDGWKVKHLRKIVETYLNEKAGGEETPFEFHALSVFVDERSGESRVEWIKNVIL
jgi:putative endonuclease